MKKIQILNFVAAVGILAAPALANLVPYPNIGTEAPVVSFTAASTGNVTLAYFFASDAGYDSEIGMWRYDGVNWNAPVAFGLPNHSSVYGQSFNMGAVNAGDTLVFELRVVSTSSSWFSDPTWNSDGRNHSYATPWSGDSIIPAGTYVGFEDLPNLDDADYNDHQFVFTNIRTSVPDGGMTLMLLGGALVGLETLRRRYRV